MEGACRNHRPSAGASIPTNLLRGDGLFETSEKYPVETHPPAFLQVFQCRRRRRIAM